ncbi:MAG: hypothetical protein Q9226_007946 [Calogaya cf. arnoldii]
MSSSNMSSDLSLRDYDDKQLDEMDIANAIRASLEVGRDDVPRAQDKWIPRSGSDWKSWRRQLQLLESLHKDAEESADIAKAIKEGDEVELPRTNSVQIPEPEVPQSEDDSRSYGDQQQPVPRRERGTWSSESRCTSGKIPRAPESSPLEIPQGDPRDKKTEDEWGIHLKARQREQNQQLKTYHSDETAAQTFNFTIPTAKNAPSAFDCVSRWRNVDEENTRQMQASQRASKSDKGEDQAEPNDHQRHSPANPPSENAPPCRQTIEDRIKEMQTDSTVGLQWTDDGDGDTFIYIDPPAKQPEQTERMYDAYVKRYQKPFLIRSTKLQALHSPFFDRLLGPTAQFRTMRRRRLNGRLPGWIKYVVELTPPSEGEDAAWLMTELCCVEGVRNWHQASARWACSTTLVGGKDEYTEQPADGAAPELSPIRHRSSIERVLNAIRDIDPNLDSAAKVYTTFTVARFFEITHSPLTDYIVRWLRAPPNSLFIEALPEIALKICDGLRCHDLIRDSFAILVGEEALAILQDISDSSYTVYGRKKNDVPEAYRTRIQYASRSFMDRILQAFENLVEPEMTWMETLPQFQKFSNEVNKPIQLLVKETKAAWKAFVRGAIYSILWSDLKSAPKFDLGSSDWGTADSLYPWTSQSELWNSLTTRSGRLMTTTFWSVLKSIFTPDNFQNATNITFWPQMNSVWDAQLYKNERELMMQKHGVAEIEYGYIENLIARCRWDPDWSSTGLIKPLKYQLLGSALAYSRLKGVWELDEAMVAQEAKSVVQKDPRGSEAQCGWDSQWSCTGQEADSVMVMREDSRVSEGPDALPKWSSYTEGVQINERKLWSEIEEYIRSVCYQMLGPPDLFDREDPMRPVMTPTLVCLGETEWKYLPLYAGGLDDESGGVFNDDVPMADAGFSTAGPGVHTGTGSSAASSDYDFVGGQELESTHHTSTMTNDSFSDQLDHRKVYTDDSDLWDHIRDSKHFAGSTTASNVDTTTLGAPSMIDGESEDGFMLPLRSREPGAETCDTIIHGQSSETQEGREEAAMPQEDYSDLFMEEDGEDDDMATEKGGNDSDTEADEEQGVSDNSEDEDMVLV